jgi:drug/metabolite transporter (DMT)-like permease
MRTFWTLTISMLAQSIGNVMVSKGMKSVSQADGLFPAVLQAAQQPWVIGGTLLLLVFFALYAAALSWADLSFVLPVTAFGYVLNAAFASFFLDEPISLTRWAGTLLICVGVVLVARTPATTPSPALEGAQG